MCQAFYLHDFILNLMQWALLLSSFIDEEMEAQSD